MPRRPKTKPEDFRDRVVELIKRGVRVRELWKMFDCPQHRFVAWIADEFPGQSLRDLKTSLGVSTPRPNNGRKGTKGAYKKEDWHPMTDEEREETQRRVREAENDYLPRLAVPVRIMTEEEMKRMS
jgi:hypothetical protein